MKPDRQGVLTQAWLILLLAVSFGAALAGVEAGWGERIEANKRAETLRRIPALVLGAEATGGAAVEVLDERVEVRSTEGESRTVAVEERRMAGHTVYAATDEASGALHGWVVRAADQGYADTIELLIGLSPDGQTLTGLYVLSQKETPGLGDAIRGEAFRAQFVGQSTLSPLEVVRDAAGGRARGEIVALTAATISSRSVCDIVNHAVRAVRGELEGALETR